MIGAMRGLRRVIQGVGALCLRVLGISQLAWLDLFFAKQTTLCSQDATDAAASPCPVPLISFQLAELLGSSKRFSTLSPFSWRGSFLSLLSALAQKEHRGSLSLRVVSCRTGVCWAGRAGGGSDAVGSAGTLISAGIWSP